MRKIEGLLLTALREKSVRINELTSVSPVTLPAPIFGKSFPRSQHHFIRLNVEFPSPQARLQFEGHLKQVAPQVIHSSGRRMIWKRPRPALGISLVVPSAESKVLQLHFAVPRTATALEALTAFKQRFQR